MTTARDDSARNDDDTEAMDHRDPRVSAVTGAEESHSKLRQGNGSGLLEQASVGNHEFQSPLPPGGRPNSSKAPELAEASEEDHGLRRGLMPPEPIKAFGAHQGLRRGPWPPEPAKAFGAVQGLRGRPRPSGLPEAFGVIRGLRSRAGPSEPTMTLGASRCLRSQ
uniref:Uncharacterized protein n=1 Tax=Oryza sativa subsp. japonica TaxID=39947 RepID=Q2R056_ORYSJ|nr:hypothetical protein LOC_Os11g43710 [Oryza sativa Japonica Group]